MRRRWLTVGGLCLLLAWPAGTGGVVAQEAGSATVDADFHTLGTPPLADDQFEVLTLSTLPDAVTGGDVLMAVRGLDPDDRVTVTRNGDDVTAAFARMETGDVRGLVTGLRDGENTVVATSRGRTATLSVINHPITGPVISGPHQTPFRCETQDAGLGEPLDANCSVETRYQWFYRSIVDQSFHELADPFAPYPGDVMRTEMTDGRVVPYVVRVESGTLNRGIARIAVLDDPAARGPGAPFTAANWNGQILYFFGSSSGVGYHQGWSNPATVLGIGGALEGVTGLAASGGISGVENNAAGGIDRLGNGDVVAHNTLTIFGVRADPFVNVETAIMMKEHITEQYGPIRRMVGSGASGGSIQMQHALNAAPGLLDGAMHFATFADYVTTAMTVTDCGLLQHYYQNSGLAWNDLQKLAVNGHNLLSGTQLNAICQSWTDAFFPLIQATNRCVSDEQRYEPTAKPDGVRCTLQDGQVNIWGRDPATGYARRPLDNTGIQYGLGALLNGTISAAQFVDLNRNIGGLDIDGNFVPQRHRMEPEVERLAYELGLVTGRGALAETPIMDFALYLDAIPGANIHESVRPFVIRERLSQYTGQDRTMSIWRGVVDPADGRPVMDQWLDALEATRPAYGGDHVQAVAAARPASAFDRCTIASGGARIGLDSITLPLGLGQIPLLPGARSLLDQLVPGLDPTVPVRIDVPEDFDSGTGLCSLLLPTVRTPRMVAGMPLSDDVIKCQLTPLDPSAYPASLTNAQFAQLQDIFPAGVCDYSQPAAGASAAGEQSMVWASIGAAALEKPHELTWRVARSSAGSVDRADSGPGGVATGGGRGGSTRLADTGLAGPSGWLLVMLVVVVAVTRRIHVGAC